MPEQGRDERPFGDDGPAVRAVDLKAVRDEFWRIYPADGATSEKRDAAKRKAFSRNIRDAAANELIVRQEVNGRAIIWFAKVSDQPSP